MSVKPMKNNTNRNICRFCYNCNVDKELSQNNDLSYCSIGDMLEGFNMCIRSGGNRKTSIMVYRFNNKKKENETIGIYTMNFCPVCGRKLIENE